MFKLIFLLSLFIFSVAVSSAPQGDKTAQQRRAAVRAAALERPNGAERPQQDAAAERKLNAQQREELRRQLRQQR